MWIRRYWGCQALGIFCVFVLLKLLLTGKAGAVLPWDCRAQAFLVLHVWARGCLMASFHSRICLGIIFTSLLVLLDLALQWSASCVRHTTHTLYFDISYILCSPLPSNWFVPLQTRHGYLLLEMVFRAKPSGRQASGDRDKFWSRPSTWGTDPVVGNTVFKWLKLSLWCDREVKVILKCWYMRRDCYHKSNLNFFLWLQTCTASKMFLQVLFWQ